MYRYEYERITSSMSGWGPLSGNSYGTEDYKRIITRRAENGWRFVTVIPAVQRGTGHIQEMDLIFEKEI